jgi:uncharacterized caspase-like protein
MLRHIVISLLVSLISSLAFAVPGQAENRIALVIGNSAYSHSRALPNPKNDVTAIAKLLRDIGFSDVVLATDLDYQAMRTRVRTFAGAARNADVALIYFAGHGLEVAGTNYLVPTDAKLVRDIDLEYEAVTLDSLLSAASGARRLRVVILDACRNNPLGEKLALSTGLGRSVTRGLARIEPIGDVLVAYAAKAGTLAEDGKGEHSPYAEALLAHMGTPGLDVRLMFGKVRDHVLAATRRRQEPYTYGSLTGEVVALVPGTPLTKAQQVEVMFWASVKDSSSSAVLGTYLERYPDGDFAPIARALIAHYEKKRRAEQAAQEEGRRREEEQRRAAEVKRLEDERRAREAAIAEARKRAEEAKNAADMKRLDEQAKTDWMVRTEELRKALDEARRAQDAAKAAEKQRLAAARAAEEATKAAKEAIAKRRDADKAAGDTTKVAALPTLERDLAEAVQRELQRLGCYAGAIDGIWGSASRSGVSEFNQHAKVALPTDAPEEASLSALRKVVARICPDAGRGVARKATSRPNALRYSKRVWPFGSVPDGARVSETTPYGRLTCVGGNFQTGRTRVCHWD